MMAALLNHRSARSHKSLQSSLGKEEVIRQLTVLSNQRATWRDANDEYKTLQRDDHKKTLQQGAFSVRLVDMIISMSIIYHIARYQSLYLHLRVAKNK